MFYGSKMGSLVDDWNLANMHTLNIIFDRLAVKYSNDLIIPQYFVISISISDLSLSIILFEAISVEIGFPSCIS